MLALKLPYRFTVWVRRTEYKMPAENDNTLAEM